MEIGGYVGKWLNVDLSRGEVSAEIPDPSLLRHFVGGYGVGARVLYERMPGGCDPLGQDAVLGFVTGPCTGTPAILGSRYIVVGKSPLTNGWGDANSGGKFGPHLKFAGYDAVFCRGIAGEPTYLLIEEGHAELRPAADLWGLECGETEAALKQRHGRGIEVSCIGPAGENLVRFAAIMTDNGRAAARSGLGAVMGSKRLKAIVVRGSRKPSLAQPDKVNELRKKYLPRVRQGAGEVLHTLGTSGFLKAMIEIGRTPIENFRGAYPDTLPDVDTLDGPALAPYFSKKYGCWGCNLVCGAIMKWERGGRTFEGHRPEYETLGLMGTACKIVDPKAVMALNEVSNRLGLDTISAGAVLAFAMECVEAGVLTASDLDGIPLAWGDGEAAVRLLSVIAERKGAGDILAEGVWRAAQRLGRGTEAFAVHAGGQELPAYDPRQCAGYGMMFQMSPTPGRHTQGGAIAFETPPGAMETLLLHPAQSESDPVGFRAGSYAALTHWYNTLNACGFCHFGNMVMGYEYVHEFLSAVTGWDIDMAECLRTGERIEAMRHLFGLREGVNPLQRTLSPRAWGRPPLQAGKNAGVTVEYGDELQRYLKVVDWDPGSTMPSRERLAALTLDALVP